MWRNTSDPVRIGPVDARALAPMAVFFPHWSFTTLGIAVAGVLVFSVLAWFGLTLPVALRMLRVLIAGPVRRHIPAHKRRAYY